MREKTSPEGDVRDVLEDDVVVEADGDELPGEGGEGRKDTAPHLGDLAQTPQLRAEANELKQCFSRYAFQSIGLCCLAFAGIFKFMPTEPIFGLGALSVLPVVYAASWLGVYKYTRSNRAFGYELYLERTRDIPREFHGRWKPQYRLLSWEEAIHAWRAVQPSLYRAIYTKPLFGPHRVRPELCKVRGPMWFLPEDEFRAAGAAWHPGRYLRNTLMFLYLIAGIANLMLLISAMQFIQLPAESGTPLEWLYDRGDGNSPTGWANLPMGSWICLGAFAGASLLTVNIMQKAVYACRRVRKGMLSVYSCGLIWQAVVVAHFTAVEKSRLYKLSTAQLLEIVGHLSRKEKREVKKGEGEKYILRELPRLAGEPQPDGFGLPGYSFWLGQEAASLAAHPLEIQKWIANRCAHQ